MACSFPSPTLQVALATAIGYGSFSDTAYYLLSRRETHDRVTSPTVVYASSTVLKAAAGHFAAQLGGGFSLDDDAPTSTTDYAYEDDSDLDEGEDIDNCNDFEEASSKAKGKASESSSAASTDAISRLRAEATGKGAKYHVFIPDVAAITWQSLVFYVYTGEVNFAPLKSRGIEERLAAKQAHHASASGLPPLCSPKSMYRLADIVGLADLKERARENISSQLSLTSITRELFSHFASTYPDVLDVQLAFLYKSGHMSEVLAQIQQSLGDVVRGQMPHVETVLSALLGKLSEVLALSGEPQDNHVTPDREEVVTPNRSHRPYFLYPGYPRTTIGRPRAG